MLHVSTVDQSWHNFSKSRIVRAKIGQVSPTPAPLEVICHPYARTWYDQRLCRARPGLLKVVDDRSTCRQWSHLADVRVESNIRCQIISGYSLIPHAFEVQIDTSSHGEGAVAVGVFSIQNSSNPNPNSNPNAIFVYVLVRYAWVKNVSQIVTILTLR